jgi:hypothetical protein
MRCRPIVSAPLPERAVCNARMTVRWPLADAAVSNPCAEEPLDRRRLQHSPRLFPSLIVSWVGVIATTLLIEALAAADGPFIARIVAGARWLQAHGMAVEDRLPVRETIDWPRSVGISTFYVRRSGDQHERYVGFGMAKL